MAEPAELTRQLTMPDGVAIHYRLRRASANARTVIVLLHGLSSNLTRWSEFLEHTALQGEWDLLRVDLRGHGRSLTRKPIGMRAWCADLARLLDHEGYARAVLIGHSLGAHVAVNFANRHRERVLGLALIDPVFAQGLRGSLLWLSRLRVMLYAAVAVIRLANALGIYRRHIPQRDLRELDEGTRAALAAAGRPEDIVARYTSPRVDIRYFPTAHYLQELIEVTRPLPPFDTVAVPMLFVLSKGETFGDRNVAHAAIARAPHAESVTIDCYHWPLTERPHEVRAALDAWCARVARG